MLSHHILCRLISSFVTASLHSHPSQKREGWGTRAFVAELETQGWATAVFIEVSLNTHTNLNGGVEEDRFHHRFNFGGHFFGGNAVGSLVPPSRGAEDRPCRGGCEQLGIGSRNDRVVRGAFLKHALHGGDDGAFDGHGSQLGRAARGLGEIIADAKRNGSQGPIAVCEGKATARDQIAEAGGGEGLQECVLVRVMEIKCGAVEGGFISDLLDGDVGELLAIQ